MSERKLSILWHSVSPFVRSGYGKTTMHILSRLKKYGYNVICSAYYGIEPGGTLMYDGYPVLASKEGAFGVDSAAKFARQFNVDMGILFCYDDKTEVLTDHGWKLFRNLDGTELVVQYDPKENYLEYVKPSKYFVVPYEGEMYYVESRDLSLCVTPNHRLYVKKRDSTRKNDYAIEFPSDVQGKRRKYLKIATWKDKGQMNYYRRELSKILNSKGRLESNCCTRSISTNEEGLANKYQEIAVRAGFSSDIHKDRDQFIVSVKKRKDAEVRPSYGLGKDGLRKYKGYVYSVKVPSGLVLTRREHKIVINGNTDWWAFCLSEDTEALTRNGWKHHNEISDTEEVATFNTYSGAIEFQRINGKFVYSHFKEMLTLKTDRMDLLLTEDHSIVYRAGKAQRRNGRWLKKPIGMFKEYKTNNYVPVSGVCTENNALGISNDLAWLLGFIMAEGSFRQYDLRIYQSTVNPQKLEKLRQALKALGIEHGEYLHKGGEFKGYKTSPCIQFQIRAVYTKEIKKWFKSTRPKRLKDEVLYCSQNEFEAILQGWKDGDGWDQRYGDGFQILTKDEGLRDFLQTFGVIHNCKCTYYKRKDNGVYVLSFTNRNYISFVGKNNISKVQYDGISWCLNVPNGTIVVRRNGRHCVVGNSSFPKIIPAATLYGPMDHCLSEDTEILTRDKWKYHHQLEEGDEVATYNLKTEEIEFQKINKVFRYGNFKEIYSFRKQNLDLLLTEEHALIHKYQDEHKWSRINFKDLLKNFYGYIPMAGKYKDNKDLGIPSELAYLIGFTIAEGHFPRYGLGITQSVNNTNKLIKLEKCLSVMKLKYSKTLQKEHDYFDKKTGKTYKSSKSFSFHIHSKDSKNIRYWFKSFKPKLLRDEVLYCSQREYEGIMEGWKDGDGWNNPGNGSFLISTKLKEHIDFIQALAVLHNNRCSFYQNSSEIYIATITKKPYTSFGKASEVKKIPYNGIVWCVNVDNGSILVRRNGRAAIVGNTNYCDEILDFTRQYYRIIALCKWQQEQLAKVGIKSDYIYHGVDTKLYTPAIDKAEIKKRYGIPEDAFVVGTVAANCFDPETEILTKDGWKKYNEIKSDDEFLVLDKDNSMNYYKADNLLIQEYNGPMYRLKTKYLDFKVTPDHKMHVKNKIAYKNWRRKGLKKSYVFSSYSQEQAKELIGKQRWYKKNGGLWMGIEQKYFTLPSYFRSYYPSKNYHRIYSKESLKIPMDAFLKLLGYYISEGSSNHNTVFIAQSNSSKRFNMASSLSDLPFKVGIYNDRIGVSSVQLANWFNGLGMTNAKLKYVPIEFKALSTRQLQILWDAIVMGDGWSTSSSEAVGTSSRKLANDLQEIIIKLGDSADLSTSFKRGHDKFIGCLMHTVHRNKIVHEVQNRSSNKIGNNRLFTELWEKYNGVIWDVVMSHTPVMVRRNGKSAWSGRSDKEDRKSHGRSMKAMRHFLDSNPDVKEKDIVWIYHSASNDPRGMPLSSMCHKFKLDSVIRFMNPALADTMVPEEQLADLMKIFDVHLLASKREGFGLPVLETQACGVPNICHDASSMTELVKDHGWLCKSLGYDLNLETTPINAESASPDVYSIADCIKDAYFDEKKRIGFGRKAREFAVQYDWNELVANKWIPLLEEMQLDIENRKNMIGINEVKDKQWSQLAQ